MRLLRSIDELETFVSIIDSGSLSAAARRLGVTTNAVSHRLQQLEASVGVPLLQRTTRRMSLTSDGVELLARARRVLDEVQAAEEQLERRRGGIEGEVRVGIHPEMAYLGWYERLGALLERHPKLSCSIRVLRSASDPVVGELDVQFSSRSEARGEVQRTIGSVFLGLCAAPGYASRRGLPRTREELAEHECLLSSREGAESQWPLLDEQGRRWMTPVQGRLDSDDAQVLRSALYAGLGIGLRPLPELRAALQQGKLVEVLRGHVFGPIEVVVSGGRRSLRTRRVRAVLELLAEELRKDEWLTQGPRGPARAGQAGAGR